MFEGIYWEIPGRLIIAEYSGVVGLEDFQQASAAINDAIDNEGKPPLVHNITDARRRTQLDKSLFNVGSVIKAQNLTDHPLLGWTLVVDSNPHPVMRFVGTTVTQLTSARFRIFTDMDEARDFLYEVDSTLESSSIS